MFGAQTVWITFAPTPWAARPNTELVVLIPQQRGRRVAVDGGVAQLLRRPCLGWTVRRSDVDLVRIRKSLDTRVRQLEHEHGSRSSHQRSPAPAKFLLG
jgi:hypothetical protein